MRTPSSAIAGTRSRWASSSKGRATTGAALGTLACGFLTFWHDAQWQIAVVAGLFGLGIGLAFASMANLVVGSVPPEQTGAATGMNANIRTIGGSIGAALTSVLVTGRLQPSGLPYASGYTHGWAAGPALPGSGRRRPPGPGPPPGPYDRPHRHRGDTGTRTGAVGLTCAITRDAPGETAPGRGAAW